MNPLPSRPSEPLSSRNSTETPPTLSPTLSTSEGVFRRPTLPRHMATQSQSSVPSSDAADKPTLSRVRANRMSLSLPVQVPVLPADNRNTKRTSQILAHDLTTPIAEVPITIAGPTDTNFLTAIAAQERRVLELKEELQKAEANLNSLKRQWTLHEANKKRDDVRRMTKLQPLQTSIPMAETTDDGDGSNAWMIQEMERRKAIMSSGKSSNRTVFSGSRHTRTLSLLSPILRRDGSVGQPFRPPVHLPRQDSLAHSHANKDDLLHGPPTALFRASTTPDLTEPVNGPIDRYGVHKDQTVGPEVFIETGKQMASTLKDGFWSFYKDLKEATVGDEATQPIQPPHLRRQSPTRTTLQTARKSNSRSSLRASSTVSNGSKASTETKKPRQQGKNGQSNIPDLADSSFWNEFGASTTPAVVKKRPTNKAASSRPVSTASSDAWDNWDDSPQASRASSASSEAATVPSTVSATTSPRMSDDRPGDRAGRNESSSKRDSIPWPALNKFGPATLRRTASHLMSEWEKSLTPSPGQEWSGQDDYLGLSAEAAATGGNR
ncbi:Hypothetical protein R9X50_00678600 [Acrodontium crateriforme]|uniref:DUF4048 domain-containing protein n=1 Tax=Acrodontium crateriforme TaxID=150365 RepID=A0AAQ3MAQ6_9PEZI|nr:Hypothetical protein R9X50_00678600 [Acrodontium crateriforme]